MNNRDDLTIEQALLKDLITSLDKRENQILTVLSMGAFENEAGARELVGQIRAFREIRDTFRNIVARYFPAT